MSFDGFPTAALDFYDDLEIDNTKSFWESHKDTYRSAVLEPMTALTEELADEFGAAKIFRPHRDVRFAKDKTPYKTHQGAFVALAPATGYYVQIGAPGVRIAAGFYDATADRLAAIRAAIDDRRRGPALRRIVDALVESGWEIGGSTLKTAPRGYPADHPRIELLRHKSLTASRDYGFEEIIHSPALTDRIREDWRAATDLVNWSARHGAT